MGRRQKEPNCFFFFFLFLGCLLSLFRVQKNVLSFTRCGAKEFPVSKAMEVYGKTMAAAPANVIYLSTILGRDGPNPVHKCDWKCQNEHVCGNMYRCKLTGITHICDKNCNQRILYDNHSSLCRASGQVFPLTQAEEHAVRGVRRKLEADNSPPSDSCGFKRRRDAQFHPSPFERSFSAVILSSACVGWRNRCKGVCVMLVSRWGLPVDCKAVEPYPSRKHNLAILRQQPALIFPRSENGIIDP
ncbi:hypothetical protein V6N12_004986 [Hibiscus sabdariffa]|uniref:Uncharacterized protein n=1 Tax=Hibiscus sabdariffa TaxID=183260 RepID=A0ABR2CN52_9ROSI